MTLGSSDLPVPPDARDDLPIPPAAKVERRTSTPKQLPLHTLARLRYHQRAIPPNTILILVHNLFHCKIIQIIQCIHKRQKISQPVAVPREKAPSTASLGRHMTHATLVAPLAAVGP